MRAVHGEILPVDILHGDVKHPRDLADLVDLADVLVTHPRLSARERDELAEVLRAQPAAAGTKTSWAQLLTYPQVWGLVLAKFLSDAAGLFYLFWLPKFMASEHGIRDTALIPYLVTVYIIADVGSIFGGYLSSALIKRGWTVDAARKTALTIRGVTGRQELSNRAARAAVASACDRIRAWMPRSVRCWLLLRSVIVTCTPSASCARPEALQP